MSGLAAFLAGACVFPLHPIMPGPACACRQGAACASIGKHPAVRWAGLAPGEKVRGVDGAGYGIATGARSACFVVEADDDAAVSWLLEQGMPDTLVVGSARGAHFYFQHPGFPVRNSAGELAAKVDVRGDGGFVVAPGSPHKSGCRYFIANDAPVAPVPSWLLEWAGLRKGAMGAIDAGPSSVEPVPLGDLSGEYARTRLASAVEYLRSAPLSIEGQGGRVVMFKIACMLVRRQRLPLDVALELVLRVYNPRLRDVGTTPWAPDELRQRLTSARDTSSLPPGEVLSEDVWNELLGERKAS